MRPDLARLVAKRKPCACGAARVFGDRCRRCFVGRPVREQMADLERLTTEAELAGDQAEALRYLTAYEAVATAMGERRG